MSDTNCDECSMLRAQLSAAIDVIEYYGNLDNWNKETGAVTDMKLRGLDRKFYKVLDFGDRAREFMDKVK